MLRGLGDEPVLVQTFDAPREPGWDILEPMFVVVYLDGWLAQPESRAILYDVHATLFGWLDVNAWSFGEEHLSLQPRLRAAFERQDLVALVPQRTSVPPPGSRPVPAPPRPGPPPGPQRTFIEIQLIDAGGQPVAGEGFVITLPDGQERRGRLDSNGLARVDGIDPGICDVRFPDIDGREWGTAPLRRS